MKPPTQVRARRAADAMIGRTIVRAVCATKRRSDGRVTHNLWLLLDDGSRVWFQPQTADCHHCFGAHTGATPVLRMGEP
jgi:hypothetical protein